MSNPWCPSRTGPSLRDTKASDKAFHHQAQLLSGSRSFSSIRHCKAGKLRRTLRDTKRLCGGCAGFGSTASVGFRVVVQSECCSVRWHSFGSVLLRSILKPGVWVRIYCYKFRCMCAHGIYVHNVRTHTFAHILHALTQDGRGPFVPSPSSFMYLSRKTLTSFGFEGNHLEWAAQQHLITASSNSAQYNLAWEGAETPTTRTRRMRRQNLRSEAPKKS